MPSYRYSHPSVSRTQPYLKPSHPPYKAATSSRPDLSRRVPCYGPGSLLYCCCKCFDGPKLWEAQPRCVNCHHIACSLCKKEQVTHEPNLAPPIQANIMHSGPRSIENGTPPGDLGISNGESLGTSNIAGPTPNRDNQCADFTSSPGGKQVTSVTSPIRMTPGAPAAALLHSNESDHVIQNSSGCANESLSGVKSNPSVIANAATLVDNDLVPRLELLQVNSRYFETLFFEFV